MITASVEPDIVTREYILEDTVIMVIPIDNATMWVLFKEDIFASKAIVSK